MGGTGEIARAPILERYIRAVLVLLLLLLLVLLVLLLLNELLLLEVLLLLLLLLVLPLLLLLRHPLVLATRRTVPRVLGRRARQAEALGVEPLTVAAA